MRQLRPEVVDEIKDSIQLEGLLQPIIVRPRPRGGAGFLLIGGWHRLAAVHKLGHATIECRVLDGLDADEARLAEIDENLIRADLTPSERASHHAERKALYLKLHPETKRGSGGGRAKAAKAKPKGAKAQIEPQQDAYTKDAAKKTARSRATIKRDVARGENIDPEALADLNSSCLDKGDELDAMVKLPVAEQRKLAARAKAGEKVSAKVRVQQVKRAEREVKLATKITALPDAKFGVIVGDPEWDDDVYSRETGMNRHPANHYPTSDIETIKKRPVASIAADDCVLFLWTTNQHLDVAIDVLRAWGFGYRSDYVWRKPSAGTGFWNRSVHETLLIGTRGKPPCPAPGTQWDSVIDADRGEHSAKPEIFLEMIEAYFPNVPKIELNRRGPARPGWSAWGNEAE
jgi:N6-adenosine-specific RNA methylase IME4/ParB-like chromosome segregation protein Spo0J